MRARKMSFKPEKNIAHNEFGLQFVFDLGRIP